MIGIIGSGPAGVSAALYLKRAGLKPTIITNHNSSLLLAKTIENYYGIGPISGEELYYKSLDNAKELGIPIIYDEVINIVDDKSFIIEGLQKKYECEYIILATGVPKKKNTIPGASKFEGKGVSYCATCDGYFFKNKRLAVIGDGEYANHEYRYLKMLTDDINLYPVDAIKEITGKDKVENIIFNDGINIKIDGIFIADEYPDSSILARKIGIIEDNGYITVNESFETNIPGVFACGDITGGIKQIATAVYEGMITANSIIAKKKKDD